MMAFLQLRLTIVKIYILVVDTNMCGVHATQESVVILSDVGDIMSDNKNETNIVVTKNQGLFTKCHNVIFTHHTVNKHVNRINKS